jgi:hypothetical protein
VTSSAEIVTKAGEIRFAFNSILLLATRRSCGNIPKGPLADGIHRSFIAGSTWIARFATGRRPTWGDLPWRTGNAVGLK